MASVTFSTSVGGDGSTVTDDSNVTTGLANGGHRARFVPALSQVVAVAGYTVTKATEAAASAASALDSANTAASAGATAGALAGADAASSVVEQAEIAVSIALASANFKGTWSSLSGALSVPAAVYWGSTYWMLLSNVANVSSVEPGVSAVWAEIQTLPIVRVPVAIEPLAGTTSVSPLPLLDATAYANVYDSDLRDYRKFEIDLATGDFSNPVYSFQGDVNSHTVASSLAFNTAHKWRCRDVALSGQTSQWMAVQGFSTGAVTIAQPTLTVTGSPSDVTPEPTLTTSAFSVVGGSDTHLNTDWQVLDDQLAVVWESLADASNKESIVVPLGKLSQSTSYTFRVRHRGTTYGASSWRAHIYSTGTAGIETPVNATPTNGATDQNGSVTLTASAFQWVWISDTHASSDWQVATDSGFTSLVVNVTGDTSNKTSYTATGLVVSQTYYWRVRYTGAANGTSGWSTAFSFTTKATFGGLIGTQGGQGFGVGVYPTTLPSGFSNMASNTDPAHANYGNYQYSDGSIMVFVPKFYYRIGSASSPRYGVYGLNAVDIVGVETYADEATANAAGYALHRAFKDGGSIKSGFFIDKYLASKNGTTSCKSVASAVPISLTTNTGYTNSNGMTTGEGTCTGILADAVLLARSRGVGTFNLVSVFMYSACALLSLAHGQASSSTTNCAWYHTTYNYPKGCNTTLKDVDDAAVTYTTAGDSGDANKPLTRANANFARTTHNGQECGVADLNGSLLQVALGVTNSGTSGTDSTQVTTGGAAYQTAFVLKTSVALSSLTHGWNGTNDAWGDASNLANKYDSTNGIFWWTAGAGTYFGNSTNQVFSADTSGNNYLRTCCGIPKDSNATNATGTDLYGKDYNYAYNRANMFVRCSGVWVNGASAGVFCRVWLSYRSDANDTSGFRAAAFGS